MTSGRRARRMLVLAVVLCLSWGVFAAPVLRPEATGPAPRVVTPAEQDSAVRYWTPDRMARTLPEPPARSTPVPLDGDSAPDPVPAAPPASPLPPPGDPPAGRPFGGIAAVGALFSVADDGTRTHYCTASVVHSDGGDLVITAAHCIHDGPDGGYRTNIVFVPGYHDGRQPYGAWAATTLLVDPRWANSADPDLDVGFLMVRQPGSPRRLEDVTGANELAANRPPDGPVRVTGYPDDMDEPITCANTTRRHSSTQLRFDCAGYTGGTSGSPWVAEPDPVTQLGLVVGVIGGYQEGGNTPDISYSPYFGDDVQALYATAAASG